MHSIIPIVIIIITITMLLSYIMICHYLSLTSHKQLHTGRIDESYTGWWYTYPSEQYESQLG